jgi:hypothetical protein
MKLCISYLSISILRVVIAFKKSKHHSQPLIHTTYRHFHERAVLSSKLNLKMSLNPDIEIKNTMSHWLTSISPGDTHSTREVQYQISDAKSIISLLADFWTVICERVDEHKSKGSPELYRQLELFTFPYFDFTVDYEKLVELEKLVMNCKPLCLHFGRPISITHYHPDYAEHNLQEETDRRVMYWAKKREAPFAAFSINTFYRDAVVDPKDLSPEVEKQSVMERLEKGFKNIMEKDAMLEQTEKEKIASEERAALNTVEGSEGLSAVMKDIYSMINVDYSNLPTTVKDEALKNRLEDAKLASTRLMLEDLFNRPVGFEEEMVPKESLATEKSERVPFVDSILPSAEIFYPKDMTEMIGYMRSHFEEEGTSANASPLLEEGEAEEFAVLQNWVAAQTGGPPVRFNEFLDSSAEHMYRNVWRTLEGLVEETATSSLMGEKLARGIVAPNFLRVDLASFFMFVSNIEKTLTAFPVNAQITIQTFHPEAFEEDKRSPCPMIIFTCSAI